MAKQAPKKSPAKKVSSKPAAPAALAKKAMTKPAAKPQAATAGAKKSTPAPVAAAKGSSKPVQKTAATPPAAQKIARPVGSTPSRDRAVARDTSARRDEPMQNRPVPVAPVPTNGKPRKNQAGLSSKELENFRDLLLQKRRELVGDMSHNEREALRTGGGSNLSNLPLHMADMGTDNYEQEFTLNLVEKERVLLREINNALAKIMDGTYGICEGTGKPISKVRLEAQPWARFSIEYARQQEKTFGR